MEIKRDEIEADWELSDEYYTSDESKQEMKLEDFMDDESTEQESSEEMQCSEAERTAEDVRQVMELTAQGKSARDIAGQLGFELEYVNNIQVCVQSFPEDNPIAVAHLILMG